MPGSEFIGEVGRMALLGPFGYQCTGECDSCGPCYQKEADNPVLFSLDVKTGSSKYPCPGLVLAEYLQAPTAESILV